MPVYFGFPVTIREAFRLFNLQFDEDIPKFNLDLQLNMHLDKFGLDICMYNISKDMYIIGYTIDEISNVWSKYINVDELIILLTSLKIKFANDITKYGANFSKIKIEYAEEEKSEIIHFPVPYIIECT